MTEKRRMIETDKTNIAQNTGRQDFLTSSLELVERLSKQHPCNKTKKNKQVHVTKTTWGAVANRFSASDLCSDG